MNRRGRKPEGHTKVAVLIAAGAALLLPALLCSLGALFACDLTEPVVETISYWPRDQHLLIYFQSPGSASNRTAEPLERAVRTYGKRVNVKLVPVGMNSDGAGQAPATLISPRGQVVACFEGAPDPAEIQALFESPGRAQLVQALKENDAVFLLLLDPASATGKQTLKVIKEAIKLARELSEFTTGMLVLDPHDTQERYLMRGLGVDGRGPAGPAEGPVVALVCARGRVADVTRGVPSEEQLIDRLQRLYRFGGTPMPSQFGEDLLLVW